MASIKGFEASLFFDKLRQPCFKTVTSLSNGEVINKSMSYMDLCKVLQVGLKEVKEKYTTIPKLPEGFYSGGLTAKKDSYWVVLFRPPGKHQWVCGQTHEILEVPFPGLVFAFDVKKGNVGRLSIFATADEVLSETSILCNYPFGHVQVGGSVCMGNVSRHVGDFSSAYSLVENFLLGVDSGHYYTPGLMAKPIKPLRELIGEVIKKKEFPSLWLVPYEKKGKPFTVADLLKEFE